MVKMKDLKKGISLRAFPDKMTWKECIEKCAEIGYDGVEINFDGDKGLTIDCSEKILKEIKEVCDLNNIEVFSVYSRNQWLTPISSDKKETREIGKKTILKLIEFAEILDSPSILIIPGAVDTSLFSPFPEIVNYKDASERVKEVIGEILPVAEKKKKILALENVPNKIFISPVEFKNLIDFFKSDFIACQFDVGNCFHLNGYPEQWIRILNKRIKVVHLKDYKIGIGNYKENVVNIFEGDINWKEVCKAIAEIDYKGPLICEVLPPYKYYPEVLWQTSSIAISLLIKDIENYKKFLNM